MRNRDPFCRTADGADAMNFLALLDKADALVTAARVRRWTVVFLTAQMIVLVVFILGTHGMLVTLDHSATTDFASFYAAGMLANGPHPALVYDRLAHFVAEQAATQAGIKYVYFFYPPVFLLLCSLLARLPYLCAFLLFEALTVAACLLTMRAIIGGPVRLWLLPALSFTPAIWCVGVGQNSFLTATLFGCGTLLLQSRRPIAAGLVLAFLFYKPHTGLLIPIALIASGSVRTVISAASGVLLIVAGSVLAFGDASWFGFLHAITRAQGEFSAGDIAPFGYTASIYGAASVLGAGRVTAQFIQIVVGVLVAACVFQSWRSDNLDGTRYASLISGTILVMPVVLFYDIVLLLIASAWLYRAIKTTGSLPGERMGLALIWLVSLACYPVARAIHLPIACSCATGLFILALARQHQMFIYLRLKNYICGRPVLRGAEIFLIPQIHNGLSGQ